MRFISLTKAIIKRYKCDAILIIRRQCGDFCRCYPFCQRNTLYASGIEFFDSREAHLCNLVITSHERVSSKAELYRLYSLPQTRYFPIKNLQCVNYKSWMTPIFLTGNLTKSFCHHISIAWVCTAMRASKNMIHCVVAVLNSSFIEHCFSGYRVHHFFFLINISLPRPSVQNDVGLPFAVKAGVRATSMNPDFSIRFKTEPPFPLLKRGEPHNTP